MEQSDEVLIEAHLQGDPEAFGELVRRHGGPLLGYLVQGSGNHHHAEDCFQETFVRIHKKASSFTGRGSFKSWLYSIATNVANDGYRKRKRAPQMISLYRNNDTDENGPPIDVVDKNSGPFEAAALAEQKEQVRSAIEQLPIRQRDTLVLAYYQGLSYSEVAKALGCSLGTVKSQMFRALKKLATMLPKVTGGEQ